MESHENHIENISNAYEDLIRRILDQHQDYSEQQVYQKLIRMSNGLKNDILFNSLFSISYNLVKSKMALKKEINPLQITVYRLVWKMPQSDKINKGGIFRRRSLALTWVKHNHEQRIGSWLEEEYTNSDDPSIIE